MMNKQFMYDLIERVAWTAVQAGVSVLLVALTDVSYTWVTPVAAALAILKNVAGKKIGDPNTGSWVPSTDTGEK